MTINHKPLAKVKDELSASMFARTQQEHNKKVRMQDPETVAFNRRLFADLDYVTRGRRMW